jgi:hypothetical protein
VKAKLEQNIAAAKEILTMMSIRNSVEFGRN